MTACANAQFATRIFNTIFMTALTKMGQANKVFFYWTLKSCTTSHKIGNVTFLAVPKFRKSGSNSFCPDWTVGQEIRGEKKETTMQSDQGCWGNNVACLTTRLLCVK